MSDSKVRSLIFAMARGAAQGFVVLRLLFRRKLGAVAFVEQARDLPLAVEDALALHLGGVGGEHRRDVGLLQRAGDFGGVHAGAVQALEAGRERTLLQVTETFMVHAPAAEKKDATLADLKVGDKVLVRMHLEESLDFSLCRTFRRAADFNRFSRVADPFGGKVKDPEAALLVEEIRGQPRLSRSIRSIGNSVVYP